jgi:hypothetical protein
VLDTSKAELTLAAIRNGMPKMLSIQARLRPLQAAATTWAKSARELGAASGELAQSFKDQALCISGQISGAVSAIAHIEASINVSVSVSASASGSVGTNDRGSFVPSPSRAPKARAHRGSSVPGAGNGARVAVRLPVVPA